MPTHSKILFLYQVGFQYVWGERGEQIVRFYYNTLQLHDVISNIIFKYDRIILRLGFSLFIVLFWSYSPQANTNTPILIRGTGNRV